MNLVCPALNIHIHDDNSQLLAINEVVKFDSWSHQIKSNSYNKCIFCRLNAMKNELLPLTLRMREGVGLVNAARVCVN